jgi:membrane-associated protein
MFDPGSLIRYGGLLLLFLTVYCQTGLFFCFFIPSGALLFTAGVFIATGTLPHNAFIVCSALSIAAFLGNITGYLFGLKAGPLLYEKKESRFFKQKHLIAAEAFYNKYGNTALAVGLFFPIIRTFSPIVAGMVKLNFRRFMVFTFIGSVLWITIFVLAGYLTGTIPILKPYINFIIIGIILVVTTPVIVGIIRNVNKAGKQPGQQD